jgi:hypothetical protein
MRVKIVLLVNIQSHVVIKRTDDDVLLPKQAQKKAAFGFPPKVAFSKGKLYWL